MPDRRGVRRPRPPGERRGGVRAQQGRQDRRVDGRRRGGQAGRSHGRRQSHQGEAVHRRKDLGRVRGPPGHDEEVRIHCQKPVCRLSF